MEFHALIYLFSLWINNSDWAFTEQIKITKIIIFSASLLCRWTMILFDEDWDGLGRVKEGVCSSWWWHQCDLGNLCLRTQSPQWWKVICLLLIDVFPEFLLFHLRICRHTHTHIERKSAQIFVSRTSCLGSILCNGFLTGVRHCQLNT